MPDFWSTSWSVPADGSPWPLAWRIGVATALGVAVAGLNRWARRGEEIPPTFQATLVLLAALIAMATQIIGDNVARAFSLVGALSVVRFRTVVKDTQDTSFVILAVVVGMAAGANQLAVGLVGLAIVGATAVVLWPPGRGNGWTSAGAVLSIRVGLADPIRQRTEATLAASTERCDLISAATAKQGSSLELTYRVRLRPSTSPVGLVAELNALEGVESVQLGRES